MPIEATVKFTKSLTKVSIEDRVGGGYGKDENGKDVINISPSANDNLKFFTEPYDGTIVGYIIITGKDGRTPHELKIKDLKDGQSINFP